MTTHTTLDTITQQQISDLRFEAALAGDETMCMTAKLAQHGDRDAIAACVSAINQAEAQSDAEVAQ